MAADTEATPEIASALADLAAVTLPDPVERGRYAVFPTPDGGWAIARSGPLCDTCQGCGCGEQQDPILVPAMVVRVITGESGLPGPLQKMLGRFGG